MEISREQQKTLFSTIKDFIQRKLQLLQLDFEDAHLAAGAKKGEVFLGKLLQISVHAKSRGMQSYVHLMAKFAITVPFLRENIRLQTSYQREVLIYENVFPIFSQMQMAKPFIGYPEYYGSRLSDKSEVILMYDLKYEGFQTVNRLEPLDYTHMMLVMREYARFHALSFAMREKEPAVFSAIATELEKHYYVTLKNADIDYVKKSWEKALRTLNPETHQDILNKFNGVAVNFFERMLAATAASKATKFAIICHGDSSITNIMFKYTQCRYNKKPTELTLVDFQLAKLGSPALDLSHLLFTCTDKSLRSSFYLDLLQEYHKHLIEFGKELRVEIDLPFNTLTQHMKAFSIYGLYMAVTNLYLQMSSDDDIPNIDLIRSRDDAAFHFNHPCSNMEAYESRIRDVLIEFCTRGYEL